MPMPVPTGTKLDWYLCTSDFISARTQIFSYLFPSLLFAKTRRKKQSDVEALHSNTWIPDLNHRTGFTTTHLA
jgi:hypothetical protein